MLTDFEKDLIKNSDDEEITTLKDEIFENNEIYSDEIENLDNLSEQEKEILIEKLEYQISLAEYEKASEDYNTQLLESINNNMMIVTNCSYIGAGAVVSIFVFFVLVLVIKFFKSLIDF